MEQIDASQLTAEEYEKIMYVIKRDERLRRQEEQRIFNLKAEIQRLRKRGIIKPGLDQSRVCARCLTELGRIINRGAFCPVCRKKVCKVCRVNGDDDKIWVCIVCHKQMQLKAVSGEWMREFTRSSSEKIRPPSSKTLASARENMGGSFTDSLKQSFKGLYNQINSSEEVDLKKQDSASEVSVDVRTRRGVLPPKLPTIDNSLQRHSPPASAGSSGGSQESSPKPPISPVLKVYQQAVDLMSSERKCVPIPEKEMVYRKIYVTTEKKCLSKAEKQPLQKKTSNRLHDSSSSSDEDDSPRTSLGAAKSSESTPSPRTPNSYKILSGIAHNQATAFQFPPSPLYSRPSSHERQSSDEFSTPVSSLRSRSTSSETNDDSSGLAPQPLPRSRRISPLRKQQAIAEELSSEVTSRNSSITTEYPQTSGADSGISDCNVALSPKLLERNTSKEDEVVLKKCPSEDSESSLNDTEGTVEKTTGYLFRKVTVKRRNFQQEANTSGTAEEGSKTLKSEQHRNLVQKSKSEDIASVLPPEFRHEKLTLDNNFCECNECNKKLVLSSFLTLRSASPLKRFLHADSGCSRCAVNDPLNSETLTKTANTNTKRCAKHEEAINTILVSDGDSERHFVKKKHLSSDSPTKRKIKKLSDRAKRLRDRLIPCTTKSFKELERKVRKSNVLQYAQYLEPYSANVIGRSASLPNNANHFLVDSNLSFRCSSVDNKLWDIDSWREFDLENEKYGSCDHNKYQLVYVDSADDSLSLCKHYISKNIKRKTKTLKVRSHIEISDGTAYVEDSDWEMCSDIGDYSDNLVSEALIDFSEDYECNVCETNCEEIISVENIEASNELCEEICEPFKHVAKDASLAAENVNIAEEFAFGIISWTGNERKDQVNNSERVVTRHRYHSNARKKLKSVEETVNCSNLSSECFAQNLRENLSECLQSESRGNVQESTVACFAESAFNRFEANESGCIQTPAIVTDNCLTASEDVFSTRRSKLFGSTKREQVCNCKPNIEDEKGNEQKRCLDVQTVAGTGSVGRTLFFDATNFRQNSAALQSNCNRNQKLSLKLDLNSVLRDDLENIFCKNVSAGSPPCVNLKYIHAFCDFFLRPFVKKDLCLNSIKLAVNVDDVSKQIVVCNASLGTTGCVAEDCVWCNRVFGRSKTVIAKHAMDSVRVNVDSGESTLHATEHIDYPTQIKPVLTNELSLLKEVTDYECGPPFTLQTQLEGDCAHINSARIHSNCGDRVLNSSNFKSCEHSFLRLLADFCDSFIMECFANAHNEIKVSNIFNKEEENVVCFKDSSLIKCDVEDNCKQAQCPLGEEELGLLRKYYFELDLDDDEITSEKFNDFSSGEMESLVDGKDEADERDNISTSSDDEIYQRNYDYEDNSHVRNYGNPLAYSLHTIIEESESESLPPTPESSGSTASEAHSLQIDRNCGENNDYFLKSGRVKFSDNLEKDAVAFASSHLKRYMKTCVLNEPATSSTEEICKSVCDQNDQSQDKKCSSAINVCRSNEHVAKQISFEDENINSEKVEWRNRLSESEFIRQTIVEYEKSYSAEMNGATCISQMKKENSENDECQSLITPLEILESQITRLMLAVSPESSSISDNNSCSGSTLESNNSDYGSDVVELTENSSDDEKSQNLLNKITGNSPRIVRRESQRSVAESVESNVSEETVYICKRLMNSLKKLTHLSFTEDSENENSNSDFVKAKAYIREQIIELMQTVQSSSRQNSPFRQRKVEKSKSCCSCRQQNEQCSTCDTNESTDFYSKSETSPKKTPSESGSETISVSVSIPSYGDSDNTAAEGEVSHEMEELFSMIPDNLERENISEDTASLKSWEARISLFSNVKAAAEIETQQKTTEQASYTEDVTNCQEITVNGMEFTGDNENSTNSLTSPTNSHKTVVKIDENVRTDNMSPLFESLKDRSFSSDSVSSIQTVKARSVNLTAPSISELNSEENDCVQKSSADAQCDVQSVSSVATKSLNAKEKASSENNLLVVNFMSQTKTNSVGTKVTGTKSTGNISDIEVTCTKSAFRDTGYYSFKSSEESVKSLGTFERNSPTLNYNTLPNFKSHAFTETIFEVEEEQDVTIPSITKRLFTRATNHSLSSSNIPDDIFKGSKTNSLPNNCRNAQALQSPSSSQRARSSFFSTSGVLRKLSLLRDDKSLGRKLRGKIRTASGGTLRSSNEGVPHISVSDYSEHLSHHGGTASLVDGGRRKDDVECTAAYHSRSQTSLSSFGMRSESMSSIYSAAGGGRYGTVNISGEILFSVSYNRKCGVLQVFVKECRNLAAVDTKRNRSDPYVKVYLLPDRTKAGKRKTKVKKHTVDPIFDEVIKFNIAADELERRTLWLSIWHSDIFGRNDFLGEVTLPISRDTFKDTSLRWFPLQDKIDAIDHCYSGNLFIALKYVSFDSSSNTKRISKGTLHVMIKEAHNLMPTRSNGTADPFCKCYLLPDRSKTGKQKTAVIKKTCDPKWNHTFVYDSVTIEDLKDRCLELTIWDYDKLTSNDFLGGVRLSLGNGKHGGHEVEWMDSTGDEITMWQQMLERLNMWVYGELRLRPTLQSRQ